MTDLYENLLKATDNTNDITTEKYGIITKIDGLLCSVKEIDNDIEHSNVPIVNGAKLETGDKVVIGFLNNSIYDIVCYGVLDRQIETNWEDIKDKPTTFPPTPHNHISSEITDLINTIYPIGSIYMSVNDVNPSILFGGEWEAIEDRFLLSKGSTYTTLEGIGGSATVSLTQSEMPRHNHTTNAHTHNVSKSGEYFVTSEANGANNTRVSYSASGNRYVDGMTDNTTPFHHRTATGSASPTTKYTGGTGTTESESNGSAHENMPPYLIVNIWKRIG